MHSGLQEYPEVSFVLYKELEATEKAGRLDDVSQL